MILFWGVFGEGGGGVRGATARFDTCVTVYVEIVTGGPFYFCIGLQLECWARLTWITYVRALMTFYLLTRSKGQYFIRGTLD
jgi:hypothetical protein